jgi:uncharacterized damage-inducible protein DinB
MKVFELNRIIEELKNIHDGDAWHGASLREALAGLNDVEASTKPIANAHSIWEIVSHIAGWENVFRRRLEGENVSEPEAGDFPPVREQSAEAWRQTLNYLEDEHEKLLNAVSKLSGEMLGTNVAHRDYTVRFLLRSIVRHHVYHTGQIALLRKAFVDE